jgi:hypothetical protein
MKVSQVYLTLIVLLLASFALNPGAREASASSIQADCSSGGTQVPMMLAFTNYGSEPVNLYWLDYECVEQYYATVNPNASYFQPTYDGHEWSVVTVSEKQIGIIIADSSTNRIDIHPSTSGTSSITTRTDMGCSSGGTNDAVTVTFTNSLAEPVDVFWLDSGCIAIPYTTLDPGASYEQPTYDGHEWEVFTTSGAYVGTFAASATGRSIEILAPVTRNTDAPAVTEEVCSSGGTQAATTVTFTNELLEPIHLFWLDYNCDVQYYTSLVSAAVYEQPSYDGHEWVVYTTTGEYVGNFVASSSAPEIEIR